MTKYTPEFLAHYPEYYGYDFAKKRPVYTRCCEEVPARERGERPHQCARNNGFGPDGAYCKIHDPKAKGERNRAASEKYAKEMREWTFKHACVTAIRQIAEGHNDPRGLALKLLKDLEG